MKNPCWHAVITVGVMACGSSETATSWTESAGGLSATPGWTVCAQEGQSCSFTGTRDVRYGVDGAFVTKTLSEGTPCTNAVFGDPAYGRAKECAFATSAAAGSAPPPSSASWTFCANENETCSFAGTREVRYGTDTAQIIKTLANGTPCTNAVFGDPAYGQAKRCSVGGPPAGSGTSPGSSGGAKPDYAAVVRFDYAGENGVPFGRGVAPFAPSIGYPAGVPNGYNWKFGAGGTADVQAAIRGRGAQQAGAAYDQIYQHRPGDALAPNARVLLEPIQTFYLSIADNKWHQVEKQTIGGAAFAEDFVNNQATGADLRGETNGAVSVRAGTNAAGQAGTSTGRTTDDGPVGYNFHGFDHRFVVDWADVKAIVVTEIMSCIPDAGSDLSDCDKLPYIANVGLDSWASTSSDFDGFRTHGGVSGARFKPVTVQRQLFTNYSGPLALLDSNPPPVPTDF